MPRQPPPEKSGSSHACRAGPSQFHRSGPLCRVTLSDDEALTRSLLDQVKGQAVSESAIKNALHPDAVKATDRRAKFLGIEAYETEGGTLTRDLFSDEVFLASLALLDGSLPRSWKRPVPIWLRPTVGHGPRPDPSEYWQDGTRVEDLSEAFASFRKTGKKARNAQITEAIARTLLFCVLTERAFQAIIFFSPFRIALPKPASPFPNLALSKQGTLSCLPGFRSGPSERADP